MKTYRIGDRELTANVGFEADGTRHPANWAELWTDEDFARWGITVTEIPDPEPEPQPEPRRMVEKWVIMERLTDEQLEAAMSLMTVRQQEKWRMPGYPSVYVDDPEVLALLQAIGADPSVVMA